MRTIHKALRYLWFVTLAASLLVSAGCKKKKPAVPPPQAQAPTITPAPQPAAQTPPSATKPPAQPDAGTETNTQTATKTTPAPPPSPPPGNSQIAPGMSPVDEYHSKQTTAQLIERCETGLKGINRNLSDEEKATLSNIRNFITQARSELANGDVELAHNYA